MVNAARLMDDIDAMSRIGRRSDGGICRQALSPAELEGRSYLAARMRDAGMTVRTDAAGNIIGRREPRGRPAGAEESSTAAVVLGSHIDSIERGGAFDGTVGVFGALECVRTLNERAVPVRRPVEVIAFTDEEERFLGFLGSYAFVGALGYEDIRAVTDGNGASLSQAMREAGLQPERIGDAARDPRTVAAFIELHIEQGPILDREGVSVGVVEQVKGDYRWRVTVEGRTDHAGAPLPGRQDAFMAMHRVVASMVAFRDATGDPETTLTVGRVTVEPNVETAQPGRVTFSVDIRSPRLEILRRADRELEATIDGVAAETGTRIRRAGILIEDPVHFDAGILQTIRAAAEELGYPYRALASGAGHDAQVIGQHMPAAMIFVPSVGGRSHCPEEHTTSTDIEAGVNVLYETMVRCASA